MLYLMLFIYIRKTIDHQVQDIFASHKIQNSSRLFWNKFPTPAGPPTSRCINKLYFYPSKHKYVIEK